MFKKINVMFKKINVIFSVIFLLLSIKSYGVNYYVSPYGNDSNKGTNQTSALKTIQKAANVMKAGDTVYVLPGNYSETVTTKAHGTEIAPISFIAFPENDSTNQVVTTQFRIQHRYTVIRGFNLTGGQNNNGAIVRIEYNPPMSDGSFTTFENNTIRDGVYLMSDDLQFNHLNNSITTYKQNWVNSGFVNGGYLFLGSCSKTPYANHDTAWRVAQVTPNTIYLTNSANTSFVVEPNQFVWGVIYAGANNNAYSGLDIILGKGTSAASNCTIRSNTFRNLFGPAIRLTGNNHLIENNYVTGLHSYCGITIRGNNHLIRSNLWKDCTNFIFYTMNEIKNIPHPAGSNFYDYQVAFISTFANDTTNIVFEKNWFQNIHNQMGLISHYDSTTYGFLLTNNVFVGVQSQLSGSRNGLKVVGNTFYRCAFDFVNTVLTFGGTKSIQTDLVIKNNAFIDNGYHYNMNNEGYYSIVNSVNYIIDENFVCGPETTGFNSKRYFSESNGINGGDPILFNPENPLGDDGVPFTDDDGLKPLPTSPLINKNIGALKTYTPAIESAPISHFAVTSPYGWFDLVGESYDPIWCSLEPYQRTTLIRPYNTPEVLGKIPLTVTFSAINSYAGLYGNITSYEWNFGDSIIVTTDPNVSKLFTKKGNVNVSLTIRNSLGLQHTSNKTYTVK
jgi:hypothetical protein